PHTLIFAHVMPYSRRYRTRHHRYSARNHKIRLARTFHKHNHHDNTFASLSFITHKHHMHFIKMKKHITPIFYTRNTLFSTRYHSSRT
ncbi:MAG: hypothetical protein J6P77_05620, partial [Acetobacter sp.]|nr:hypothetical protein [Acetobacter sp.]